MHRGSIAMSRAATKPHCTTSVNVTDRVNPALVADTTIEYVPLGVTGEPPPPPPPPPGGIVLPDPHPAITIKPTNTINPVMR